MLELTWWGREMSNQAQVDMTKVVDRQLGSKRCGKSKRRVIVLKLTWWEWDSSSQA